MAKQAVAPADGVARRHRGTRRLVRHPRPESYRSPVTLEGRSGPSPGPVAGRTPAPRQGLGGSAGGDSLVAA
jgi:hypothetical protein